MDAILPDTKVLIVQLLTFALGMSVIWKLYIVPLREHLRLRREGIAKDLESAEAARREAEQLKAELARERARMAEELKAARAEAREEVAQLRAGLLAKAEEQQAALLRQAQERIEGETRKAQAELRAASAALVVEAAGRLLEKRLDSRADLELAERLVASVGAKAGRN